MALVILIHINNIIYLLLSIQDSQEEHFCNFSIPSHNEYTVDQLNFLWGVF